MTNTPAFCPHCGTQVPEGSRFCSACGQSVSDPAGATTITIRDAPKDDLLEMVADATRGEYEIERELGRGGMAAVYLATEIELRRKVAIKVLPPEFTFGEGMIERFQREARTAAQMDHPNIVPIFRVGAAGRLLYFAMKYVEGRSLSDVIHDRGALPIPSVTAVLEAVGSALAYAHERGVVHRDIKPANILIDRQGVVLVSDFGIARAASEATITESGAVVGTPQYMSPEQCMGQRVDSASDQYSLGVVGFEMLAGHVPFDADSAIGLIHKHISEPPPPLAPLRDDASGELVSIVERAIKKKTEERFPDMTEFTETVEMVRVTEQHAIEGRGQLKALALGDTISGLKLVTPISGATKTKKKPSRKPVLFGALTVVVALTVTGWFQLVAPRLEEPTSSDDPPAIDPGTQLAAEPGSEAGASDSVSQAPSDNPTTTEPAQPATPDEQTTPRNAPVQTPFRAVEDTSTSPVAEVEATQTPVTDGTLVFAGLPDDAEVRIDGNRIVGARATLLFGEHEITINVPGYEPYTQNIVLAAGQTRTVTPSFIAIAVDPGQLTIGSLPPGTLFIDDQRIQQTPVRNYNVPAGERHIRIEVAGFAPFDTMITIQSGATLNLGMIRLVQNLLRWRPE